MGWLCRVMTVSFHQYGIGFFPGTGPLDDVGEKRGKFYSLNVPLRSGTTDATFHSLYKPIMSKVMEVFNPSVIVFQAGGPHMNAVSPPLIQPHTRDCLPTLTSIHDPVEAIVTTKPAPLSPTKRL